MVICVFIQLSVLLRILTERERGERSLKVQNLTSKFPINPKPQFYFNSPPSPSKPKTHLNSNPNPPSPPQILNLGFLFFFNGVKARFFGLVFQFQLQGQFVSLSFLLIVFLSKLFYFPTTLLSYVEFRFAPAFNFFYFIICKKESFFLFN